MILAPIRFKTYVWPHNPRTYEIAFTRDIAYHKVPFGAYILQNMGRGRRVLRGAGEFAGDGAYDEFKKLATVFYDNTPGLLVHPVWQESYAYFAKLVLKQVPTENYVAYEFEFWESFDQYGAVSEAGVGNLGDPEVGYVRLKDGESFWTVATKYGDPSTILSKNPQIQNPNSVPIGTLIKIN